MRELGRSLAAQLRGGDLLVLSGELGAGKTTFTQGLGDGLGVRGDVTSPTFVIARVHPSLVGGPPLVHVDAYRLGGIDELDDLDLDTSLDDAVTVVEWGEGIAEGLAESRLEIRIIRALAHQDEHADLDPRRVLMTPIGPRWYEMEVPSTRRARRWPRSTDENLLLDFRRCPEAELDDLDPYVPLQLSLIVCRARRPRAAGPQQPATGVGAARSPTRPGRARARGRVCACSARRPVRPRRRRLLRRRDRAARAPAPIEYAADLPHEPARHRRTSPPTGRVDRLAWWDPGPRLRGVVADRRAPGADGAGGRPARLVPGATVSLGACCSPSTPPPRS